MRIIMRDVYKIRKDVLIAEVYDEDYARILCKMLNLSKGLNDSNVFYQVVEDNFKIK